MIKAEIVRFLHQHYQDVSTKATTIVARSPRPTCRSLETNVSIEQKNSNDYTITLSSETGLGDNAHLLGDLPGWLFLVIPVCMFLMYQGAMSASRAILGFNVVLVGTATIYTLGVMICRMWREWCIDRWHNRLWSNLRSSSLQIQDPPVHHWYDDKEAVVAVTGVVVLIIVMLVLTIFSDKLIRLWRGS